MSLGEGVEPLTLNRSDGAGELEVLHVDDERNVAEVTSSFLERHIPDVNVSIETNPEAGLERLENERVDCVVSDYEMPEMDGLSFLDVVREEYPELPFILFTGKGSEEIASEAISRGVTDYLQKGTETEQYELLANRIENAVEQARVRSERDEAHARFKALTENASFAVLTIDEESTIHYVNDAIGGILGYEQEELLGDSLLEMMPERFHDAHQQAVDQYLREGEPNLDWSWIELPGLHVEGHEVPLGISFNEMRRESGLLFTAIIRDITEQRERERELEQYETLLETVTDGVYAVDAEGRYTYINSWMEEKFGYDREEVIGTPATKIIPEEANDRFEEGIRKMLAGEKDTFSIELEVPTADGELVPFESKITTLMIDGEFAGTVGIARDVSERKAREEELHHEKAVSESILDVQPDVFYLFDESGQFLRWNDRLSEVTGYSDEEIAEMTPLDFVPEDDYQHISNAISRVFQGEKAVVESALVTKDGERIPYEFTGALVTDEDGVIGLAGFGRNAAERKERERELERQNERLEEFASVVSHDLKGPLSVAKGSVTLAAEDHHSDDLETAAEALDRMDRLITNLLDLARKGQQVEAPEPVRLDAVAEDGWNNVVEASDHRLETDEATVMADFDRLCRVFENLFQNAVDHSDSPVTVRVGVLEGEGFYVADDGPGIPAGDHDDIFERGYTTDDDGTGFGLAIVRSIVEAHGWAVDVTASSDGGARFEITDLTFADEE